jgi:hypothetical protein
MTVIYYSTDYPADQLLKLTKAIKMQLGDDVLYVPKEFDVMLDCSVEQLESVKTTIEEAIDEIKQKENK